MDFESSCPIPKRLNLAEIVTGVKEKVGSLTGFKPMAVVEANPCEDGKWVVKVELMEREAIPSTMDLIGLYEVTLNAEGEVLAYSRLTMRKRGEGFE